MNFNWVCNCAYLCVYVCVCGVCICLHEYMSFCVFALCLYVGACLRTCVPMCQHKHMNTSVFVCAYGLTRTCVCACVCVCVCTHVCVRVCLCVYTPVSACAETYAFVRACVCTHQRVRVCVHVPCWGWRRWWSTHTGRCSRTGWGSWATWRSPRGPAGCCRTSSLWTTQHTAGALAQLSLSTAIISISRSTSSWRDPFHGEAREWKNPPNTQQQPPEWKVIQRRASTWGCLQRGALIAPVHRATCRCMSGAGSICVFWGELN